MTSQSVSSHSERGEESRGRRLCGRDGLSLEDSKSRGNKMSREIPLRMTGALVQANYGKQH
jgi:hypothetical protein